MDTQQTVVLPADGNPVYYIGWGFITVLGLVCLVRIVWLVLKVRCALSAGGATSIPRGFRALLPSFRVAVVVELLLWTFLFVASVAATFVYTREGFVGVRYDKNEIALVHRRRETPIVLEWREVRSISVRKRKPQVRWSIIIRTVSGQEYQSVCAPTREDSLAIERAATRLSKAYSQYKKT